MTDKVKISRRVCQRDIISYKLFTLVFEDVLKNLSWDDKGIGVQREKLNNLGFADDVVILAQSYEELQEMLRERPVLME